VQNDTISPSSCKMKANLLPTSPSLRRSEVEEAYVFCVPWRCAAPRNTFTVKFRPEDDVLMHTSD